MGLHLARASLFLASQILAGNAGTVSPEGGRFFAGCFLACALAAELHRTRTETSGPSVSRWDPWTVAALAGGAVWLVVSAGAPARAPRGRPLLDRTRARRARLGGRAPVVPRVRAPAFFAALVACALIADALPWTWATLQAVAVAETELVRTRSRRRRCRRRSRAGRGGVLAGAVLFVLCAALTAAPRVPTGARIARAGASVFVLAAVLIAVQAGGGWIARTWSDLVHSVGLHFHPPRTSLYNLTYLALAGGLLAVLPYAPRPEIGAASGATPEPSPTPRWALAALPLAALGAFFATWTGYAPVAPTAGARIVFATEPADSALESIWGAPTWENLGLKRSGLYGCLRVLLEGLGYEVEVHESELTPDVLDGAAALVLILPEERLGAPERDAVWSFLEEGGALLALTDHTDLGRSMDTLNELLEEAGIRVNFDSAMFLGQARERLPHGFPPPDLRRRPAGAGDRLGHRRVALGRGARAPRPGRQARVFRPRRRGERRRGRLPRRLRLHARRPFGRPRARRRGAGGGRQGARARRHVELPEPRSVALARVRAPRLRVADRHGAGAPAPAPGDPGQPRAPRRPGG